MSKFGLLDDPGEDPDATTASLSERLAAFPPAAPRHLVDLAAADAAAAPHGFVSREPAPLAAPAFAPPLRSRRRRIQALEPTRHLAIRLTASQYDRFVAYADRYQLTYHEALVQLLEDLENAHAPRA